MKVNLDGLLRVPGAQGYAQKTLRDNLLSLRTRHEIGNGKAALDEFFAIYVFDSAPQRPTTHSRQVMNPPGDEPEAGNLANAAPRSPEHDGACREKTGTSSCPEARPVTATAQATYVTCPGCRGDGDAKAGPAEGTLCRMCGGSGRVRA